MTPVQRSGSGKVAEPPEQVVHRLLESYAGTVAVAESLTGGLVGQRLTATPGASGTFRGGVIAYATDVKVAVLGVSGTLLEERGAVDPDVAFAMAHGVRRLMRTVYGLGLTGVAGPGPVEGKPAGTVHVALSGADGIRVDAPFDLHGVRGEIREQAAEVAIDLLSRVLAGDVRGKIAGS